MGHRQLMVVAAVTLSVATTVAGCGLGEPAPKARFAASAHEIQANAIQTSPADKTTDVPVSAEIEVTGDAQASDVELSADANPVTGAPRADGSSWVPAEPLAYDTTYTLRVKSKVTTFTTMSNPGNRIGVQVNVADHAVYGQAIPIVLEFKGYDIAQEQRAAVEKRLFVTSEPAQIGAWHWMNGHHLEYRPQEYWQPGTKVKVRYGIGGLPLGGGRYGQYDVTSAFTIDTEKRELIVDNASKTMIANLDGQTVKSMPISLGKASTPSSYGKMVIMEKLAKTVFDSSTYGLPVDAPGGYRTNINWAQRLTWGGEFIHAAPWSVADQGVRNVSHGCVNVSDENAEWVFNFTKIGDPITVKGTEVPLKQGNGWTVWDLSWEDFLKDSALGPR